MSKKEQTKEQKEQIQLLEQQQYTAEFTIQKKNEEGNDVTYKLHYNFEELNVDRIGAAMTSYFAYDEVLGKPVTKVTDLDHINKQEYLKRFYTAVLFERDAEGNTKPYNPWSTQNKAFDLVSELKGKENQQKLDEIKIDFFLNRGEIPKGLQEKVKSTTELMLQSPKAREELAGTITQNLLGGKRKPSKKDKESFKKILEHFSGKE